MSENTKPQDTNQRDTTNRKQKDRKYDQDKISTTAIIGDSLIKHLDCRRLHHSLKSKHKRILAETYRGDNVNAMKHHIKPCLTNKPDQVILHVGTNDLSSKNSKGIADGIAEICEIIKTESPRTKIFLSQIIQRTDNPKYKQEIQKVNNKLSKYCSRHKLSLVKHMNILTPMGYISIDLGLQF